MNYCSSTSSWKPWRWMRLDLIFSMWYIYVDSSLNRLTKFSSSSRSTMFKDILPWNISQMITKTFPINTRTAISYVLKWGILSWIIWKVNENWETTWSEFLNGGKAIVEQILASEERNKFKRALLWESVWDPSRKVNQLSKVIWDITEFTRSISFIKIGKSIRMIGVNICKDKNISRWVDQENLIYIRWNKTKICTQKRGRWRKDEKEVRQWVE